MDYEIEQAPKSSRSYILTMFLAFFVGWLGIHRFYTGYIVIGVIQLLTLGGCGLWALIDVISLVLNKYKDADGNELDGHNAGCAMIVGIILVLNFIMGGLGSLLSMFKH
jgi:TM2 domain-containing membrane protein YozV